MRVTLQCLERPALNSTMGIFLMLSGMLPWVATPAMASAPSSSLIVIDTLGPTEPAATYYAELAEGEVDDALAASASITPRDLLPQRLSNPWQLPLVPVGLSVGPLLAEELDQLQRQLSRQVESSAFFVLGSDEHSLQWVNRHAAQLRALNAVGLIVEVPDEAALQRVRQATAGLVVVPVPGDTLAEHLGLRHYPVLITGTEILQ